MRVLVAYASRHGSTAEIAERVARVLRERGLEVVTSPAAQARDVEGYGAVVVGSAAYMYHWLKEATAFVRRHRAALSAVPVWVFSSGPLGTEEVDEQGTDVRVASRPRELDEVMALVHARGERVFFGAWDASAPPIGLAERLARAMPAARAAMPSGDYRNWPEIDAWAESIADELTAAHAT